MIRPFGGKATERLATGVLQLVAAALALMGAGTAAAVLAKRRRSMD